MLRFIIGTILVLGWTQAVVAQNTDGKTNDFLPDLPLISVDHRVGKTVFVGVEPLGRLPSTGYGLRTGYYITPDSLVGLNYAVAKLETKDAVFESLLFEVTYKRFFTNSFYMDAGFASESINMTYQVESAANASEKVESSGELKRLGLVLHMGNQWQWNHFTLGCDWVGHHLPLQRSESFKPSAGGNSQDEDRQKDETRKKLPSTLQLARFYLGFSF
jgi:hypothetical protein